jgi:hypothetical protein
MVRELEVNEEKKTIHVSTRPGFYGGLFDTTLKLIDPKDTAKELCGVFAFEDAVTGNQINALSKEVESLKKRMLLPDEIQRLVHLLKIHPSETRLDRRPTSDDVLADKPEAMIKN